MTTTTGPFAGLERTREQMLQARLRPDVTLHVLSLWQPWASLCVLRDPVNRHPTGAAKQYETRSWHPAAAGASLELPFQIAIHATAQWRGDGIHAANDLEDILRRCGVRYSISQRYRRCWDLPLGAIVGVATVLKIHRTETLVTFDVDPWGPVGAWNLYEDGAAEWYAEQVKMGDYTRGRFAWALVDVQQCQRPVPFKGRQSVLYALPDDVALRVRDEIAIQPVLPNREAA
jgi:hypothetical protein